MNTKYFYSTEVNQNYQPSVVIIANNKHKLSHYSFDTSTYKEIGFDELKEKIGKYLVDARLETAYKVYQYTFYPKDLSEEEKYNLGLEYRCFDSKANDWLIHIDFYKRANHYCV